LRMRCGGCGGKWSAPTEPENAGLLSPGVCTLADPVSAENPRRARPAWLAAALLGLVIAISWFWWNPGREGRPYTPGRRTFDGPTEGLTRTAVLPTLDTPIPEGMSAVWCASFEVAWKEFGSKVVRGPVRVRNAEEVAERLNRSRVSVNDLPPGSFYAAAGLKNEGIVDTIRAEMSRRFPGAPPPEIAPGGDPAGAVAFAYLRTSLRFPIPYFENREPLPFKDAAGTTTLVSSFGIRPADADGYDRLRRQAAVLFCDDFPPDGPPPGRYGLDLCADSPTDQLILARIDRPVTLADALAAFRARVASSPLTKYQRRLATNDTLLAPDLNWRVCHHFRDLEGPDRLLVASPSPGLYLKTARQWIEFRLDRGGAELGSESMIETKSLPPRHFHFDRPFLIVLSRRGAANPYFVMWVENAELLGRFPAAHAAEGIILPP